MDRNTDLRTNNMHNCSVSDIKKLAEVLDDASGERLENENGGLKGLSYEIRSDSFLSHLNDIKMNGLGSSTLDNKDNYMSIHIDYENSLQKFDTESFLTNQNSIFNTLSSNLLSSLSTNSNGLYYYDETPMKMDNITKELGYGEQIIYNKIESLQRLLKTLITNLHDKSKLESCFNEENNVKEILYDFPLAEAYSKKNTKKSSLKVLASHGVIGSFFGASGHRVQSLQQEFDVNVMVTTKRIHFPGSNNKGVLLVQGRLHKILLALRPLYKAMQDEVIRLVIDDAVKIEPHHIKLEVEVIITESLRFLMDRNKHFKKIMQMTGANIRVIKQTFEDENVQERVLVLFGTQKEIEITLEKISLMIQDDINFKYYNYMNYPDLTVAVNIDSSRQHNHSKRNTDSSDSINKTKQWRTIRGT